MKLAQEQLAYLRGRLVDEGARLDEVLLPRFPEATVAIIRGYDPFYRRGYVKGAYFDESQARKVMAQMLSEARSRVLPDGSSVPVDDHYIMTGTVMQLEQMVITDPRTQQPLTDIDVAMVYALLCESLKK